MNHFQIFGLRTNLIKPGDTLLDHIFTALQNQNLFFKEHDILILAESAVATAQGRVTPLSGIIPSDHARKIAKQYDIDPALAEIVISESDVIVGGIPGFLLSIKSGHLLPNAGVDGSNAPEGYVTLLPSDPDALARNLRMTILEKTGFHIAVLIVDSRTHPMRYGSGGVAIACSGIPAVIDERGKHDLFGRELKVTRRAIADNLASAAELIMGESNEQIPAALIRGFDIEFGDYEGIELISPDECLFIGSLKKAYVNPP
ncbi:coenzyme F420-0:L-glutamate ligase [Methanospirillum sp. J.3.6.1-F.2.7.3]|jgi:coenzyme F420-0:L-glutamate ligase|uniref:Coenzyme F420-0:L-glutamate ligase n=1 Tax=Methanospirillum purgamenti TaxID=2834276 RepID=A0A8E7B0G6_9EURY|nr:MULTISPECIES: coenzyme F420-0:L-glutamate ligase [Methanospirillum]MDX8551623.1 coenzyme F420-0:L-glutamate ligase [Methanospirillum hungatei]QVV89689.1 coenzyme F420-0:L-glutamate ligase [Methanospirillum sp. J.3.6.1-F.2.7.3]